LELFTSFCEKGIIALGLYRLPGARDNNHPYVYTKPNPNTILTHRDKIFVLTINYVKNYVFDKDVVTGYGYDIDHPDEFIIYSGNKGYAVPINIFPDEV
jgi:hypothetical protein